MNDPFHPRARLDLTVEAARRRIEDRFKPLAPVTLPLAQAAGRVLSRHIDAPIDLPLFTNSAMDGFAVRSADIASASSSHPIVLSVSASVDAGDAPPATVGVLEAVRIGTGGAIPADCDTVIPVESVMERNGSIEIAIPVSAGRNVRLQGEDIRTGTRAVAAGTPLRPQEIGLLAALGLKHVDTLPDPAVSIVSIGAELFAQAGSASVHDANGPMLAAQVTACGGNVVRIEQSNGDHEDLLHLIEQLGDESDLVITSGGISDSNADTMAALLDSNPSAELWNVRLRPGKHLGVGVFEDYSVVALPGNPIAAFVTFELFGRVAIDRMGGNPLLDHECTALAQTSLGGTTERTDALRGRAWIDEAGQVRVVPTENRGSGVLSSLPEANCLILLAPDIVRVGAGELVPIHWLGYQ